MKITRHRLGDQSFIGGKVLKMRDPFVILQVGTWVDATCLWVIESDAGQEESVTVFVLIEGDTVPEGAQHVGSFNNAYGNMRHAFVAL